MVWVRRSFKDHHVPSTLLQAGLPTTRSSIIRFCRAPPNLNASRFSSLEYFQGQVIHSLTEQPVPAPHHPPGEKLPPDRNSCMWKHKIWGTNGMKWKLQSSACVMIPLVLVRLCGMSPSTGLLELRDISCSGGMLEQPRQRCFRGFVQWLYNL